MLAFGCSVVRNPAFFLSVLNLFLVILFNKYAKLFYFSIYGVFF